MTSRRLEKINSERDNPAACGATDREAWMSLSTRTIKKGMRLLALGGTLLFVPGRVALGEEQPSPVPVGHALMSDPLLAGFIKDALEQRPELAQARATIQADRERVPQVSALPDPVLSLGIQNDGFSSIEIGDMETSWLSVIASQTFPWSGKRDLRGEVITLGALQAEADLNRARLSIQADVERAYVDLLLVRDQLGLLAKLESLWTQADGMARARYEAGNGAQSDILRAQLERSRLKQRRWARETEERRRIAVLNRVRGHPLDDAITTNRSLVDIPDPVLPMDNVAFEDAEARSPELQKSRLAIQQSAKLVDLAATDYYPDVTVSAGVMPRWGEFDSMWQAGLSFSIPIWVGSKQSRAFEESRLRGTATQYSAEAIRQLLRQRVTERLTLLEALIEINRLYRSGLLVQSEATVSSTMAQYQVGRVTFASVLEALIGYVADLNEFYESVAETQRVDIAQREVSLDPAVDPVSGGLGGSSVPGGGMGGSSTPGAAFPSLQPVGTAGSGSTSRM
jgi:outer membrane protein TolC